RPDHRHRHAARGLLCEGDDGVSFCAADPGLRLSAICRTASCVRDRAAELASAAGVTIEHIAKKHIRKEDVVAKILAMRGDHPGLVHIISAMEACNTYKPWHDKQTHRTFLRPDTGKCLHYYFYFIDAEL